MNLTKLRILSLATLSLAACATTSSVSSGPHRAAVGLEDIFVGDDLVPALPAGLVFPPGGDTLVFRLRTPEGTGLYRQRVADGTTTRLLDWDALEERLAELRADRVEPPLDDVNRTGRFDFEPVLVGEGDRLLGAAHDDLFLLELDTGEVRFVTDDPAPELFFAPDPAGMRVAFVRDGDLRLLDLGDGVERRLTDRGDDPTVLNGMTDWAYEEELGVRRSFWWSPDGERIAFLQFDTSPVAVFPITDELATPVPDLALQRYPKAGTANSRVRLGVLDVGGGGTVWIDSPDDDAYLPRAGWTPDGASLWFERIDRDQTVLELLLADPDTGAARTVLAERDDTWVNLGPDPLFVDARTFVWTAERDGWRHLYLHRTDGSLVRRLTSGPWQVEALYGLDAGKSAVLFQGTEGDPRGRRVLAAALDGSGWRRLTGAYGTHAAELSPDGDLLVVTSSTAAQPPRVDLLRSDGTSLGTLFEPSRALAGLDLPGFEFGTLETPDGETLHTALLRPHGLLAGERRPAIVHVYGGPHAQLVRDHWGGRRHLFLRHLAARGFVVFLLDNRGSAGRGKAFETTVYRHLGEHELSDQLLGVKQLRGLPFVDPERIGVYGGSYGGFMTLMCLFRAPEVFQAGVAHAPVTDWRLYDTIYTERYMDTPEVNPEGYLDSAPLSHVEGLAAPLLLTHGTVDNNVHLQNTVQLAERLAEAGKDYSLILYPRVRHGVTSSNHRLHFHRALVRFFADNL